MGYLGDIDGNGKLNDTDVTRLSRYVIGMSPALVVFNAWTGVNPLMVADLNGDGRINAVDVSLLATEVRGGNRPEIPDVPAGVTPILGAPIFPQLDPGIPAPTALQRDIAPSTNTVDWGSAYSGFAFNTAKPVTAKPPTWIDEPWAKDLASRLASPEAEGSPANRPTLSGLLRSLSRGVLRTGR